MKRRTLHWNVFGDDGGQALTEFVIVIPVVLLFFFAILQYFSIVQASQLGNYAAYEAARVYAVRASADPSDANSKAQLAAEMVLAPIGRPVPGELGFGIVNTLGLAIGPLNSLFGDYGTYAANYFEGLFYVSAFRLQPSVLGGSVNISTNGNPTQVNVSINYPQPIFIPGLAGMWNFVNHGNIYSDMAPLANGLTGIPSYLAEAYGGLSSLQGYSSYLSQFDPGAISSVNNLVSSLPTFITPYVNVQSKCSMGYEFWNGQWNTKTNPNQSDVEDFSDINSQLEDAAESDLKDQLTDLEDSLLESAL